MDFLPDHLGTIVVYITMLLNPVKVASAMKCMKMNRERIALRSKTHFLSH